MCWSCKVNSKAIDTPEYLPRARKKRFRWDILSRFPESFLVANTASNLISQSNQASSNFHDRGNEFFHSRRDFPSLGVHSRASESQWTCLCRLRLKFQFQITFTFTNCYALSECMNNNVESWRDRIEAFAIAIKLARGSPHRNLLVNVKAVISVVRNFVYERL